MDFLKTLLFASIKGHELSWGKMSKIWSGPTKDMSAKIIFEALYFLNSSPIFDMAKKLCKVMMLITMENEL